MPSGDPMSAFGLFKLTTHELQDELQFYLRRKPNHARQVVLAGFLFLFMLYIFVTVYSVERPLAFIVLAIALASALWIGISTARNWNRTYITTLSVTSLRLESTGDNLVSDSFGYYTCAGKVTVPVSEIKSIGYSLGGRYSPCGFWATCGFLTSRCLLPGLNREQATAVAVAITQRFPEIGA